MGEPRDREWSVVRLAGTLVGLVLVLGLVVAGVVAAVWTSAVRTVGPSETADGSVCSSFSGTCSELSLARVRHDVGVALPDTARLVTSGHRSSIKHAETWAEACVPDADAVLAAAEADGFTRVTTGGATGYRWTRDLPGADGVRTTVRRQVGASGLDGVQALGVAGPCDGGTTLLLDWFLDK